MPTKTISWTPTRIKALRQFCRLSIRDFAALLEVSKTTIVDWEGDTKAPQYVNLAKLDTLAQERHFTP